MADNSFGLMSPNLFVAVFIIDVEAGDVIIFLIIKKKITTSLQSQLQQVLEFHT